MELRSCDHQHFIQAIQGGSITKILNVTRGRPTLSFKKVIEIYGSFIFDNNGVKAERPSLFEVEKRTVKSESNASTCGATDGVDEANVLEDCSFGNLTLKQIQEKCKSKKRKHSQGIDSSKRKIKVEASSSQEDCIENHMASDDSDFMETLSSWKSKISMNKNAKKRKSIKDPVSTVTQEVISVVKAEVIQNNEEFLSSCGNSAALVAVKAEVPESDCSDHCRMLYNISNNFQACRWPEDSLGKVAIEERETAREYLLGCELDYDWKGHADVIPLQIVWDSGTDVLTSDSKLSNDQSLNLLAIEFKSEESIMQPDPPSIFPEVINLDEGHNTDIHLNQLDSPTAVTPPIANEDIHYVDLGNGGDDSFLSGYSKEEYTSVSEHSFDPDKSRDCGSDSSPDGFRDCGSDSSPNGFRNCGSDSSSDGFRDCGSDSSLDGFKGCGSDSSPDGFRGCGCGSDSSPDGSRDCGSDSSSDGSRDCDFGGPRDCGSDNSPNGLKDCGSDSSPDGFKGCGSDSLPDGSRDCDLDSSPDGPRDCGSDSSPDALRDCGSDSSPDGPRDCGSDSSPDGFRDCDSDSSSESEKKQLLASVSVDEERHATEATDESTSWGRIRSSSKLHRPQRLLSTRKAISPSSQMKLCKAMQSIDLHDKEHTTCRGKLFFGDQIDDEKRGTSEELNETKRARFTKLCNKIPKIPKPLKRVSHPQGVQKSSHPSRSAARHSTRLTSMQSCAKSAISFSKRQMHETESLAMKLANELKSMKDIMAAMLRSELCLTTPLRYKVNEARMAVKNATRAEEIAKRTLSFMGRDCNRFCKLMQLADEGSPASQDVVRTNKSKKIAFADEAGGRLCQVRFYENEEGSLIESDRKVILL